MANELNKGTKALDKEDHKQGNTTVKEHYGFITATTMIIGIVIGSGIFFKSDDILSYTGGNVWLGVLVFCIGAWGIIFGSLSLTELSIRTSKNGGVVGYFEAFISDKIACGFGWFQTFVYFPTLIVVLGWVSGIYTCSLFGIPNTLEMQSLLGVLYLLFFYGINLISVKIGGYFQNATTFIKLIPLLVIAIAGFFWGSPHPELEAGVELITSSNVGLAWLAALVPIAYSFDGWIIATSITNEVKNPKKNMTLALICGPIVVLGVYLTFFLGLTKILGVNYILSTKDQAINKVGELLLGTHGTKIILIFIVISVLGVVNGLVLGGIRMPQALASKNMMPAAEKVSTIHKRLELSVPSLQISFVSAMIWFVIHYVSQKFNLLRGGDISEIAIVFSYACYIILYVKVIRMKFDGEVKGIFRGIICPIFAIVGASIIFVGGFIRNPIYVGIFIAFCALVFALGHRYFKKVK